MSMVVSEFSPEENFWELNKDLMVMEEFRTLRDRDKSEGRKESSLLMWAVAYIYDHYSPLGHLPLADRKRIVEEKYLIPADKANKGILEKIDAHLAPIVAAYDKLQETAEIRQLRDWESMMDDRRSFMSLTTYSALNWQTKDTMAKDTPKVALTGKELVEMFRTKKKGKIKGDQNLSMMAKRKFNGI